MQATFEVPENSPGDLCPRCQEINISKYLISRDELPTLELGYYQDILLNDHCSFCRLVISALDVFSKSWWIPGEYPIEMVQFNRAKDFKYFVLDMWMDTTTKTTPTGHYGHKTYRGQIASLATIGEETVPGQDDSDHSRAIGKYLDYRILRKWIDDCEKHHSSQCHLPRRALGENLELILIDVKDMRLVRSSWGTRYFSLSYVWGSSSAFYTMQSNIRSLEMTNSLAILRERLPRVVNDAISIVDSLHERYLWVNALCIVQDDDALRDRYINEMDRIFSNSVLTIVALDGEDSESPLPAVTEPREVSSCTTRIDPWVLVPRPPNLFDYRQDCLWSSRSWTFQEDILSRRRLYFSRHQAYWECQEAYGTEDCPKYPKERYSSTNPLDRISTEAEYDPVTVYVGLVKWYSGRSMTYPSDSLNAFAGILATLQDSFAWTFVSALPEAFFDTALLWSSMFSHVEILPRGEKPQSSGRSVCGSPTWCWTAWTSRPLWWDWWRLSSYVTKRVESMSEIEDYFVSDGLSKRKIRREGMLSHHSCTLGQLVKDASQNDGKTPKSLLNSRLTLEFQAKTNRIQGTYQLSIAKLAEASSLNPDGISDFFKTRLMQDLWVYDNAGHHCGTFKNMNRSSATLAEITSLELVLLSRSDQDEIREADVEKCRDRLPPEYPSSLEYYQEVFDTTHYRYKRWWNLNIMLLKWEGGVAQRIGVGFMHTDAWDKQTEVVKEIVLE
ncbi:heterokaryon incompatibility protein-domain-containing protein [Xylariaceae sp. FL0255]|nr:heterokaryon incompatibility protein-domain-containing protein [Xylariaceae sp. FL0255]